MPRIQLSDAFVDGREGCGIGVFEHLGHGMIKQQLSHSPFNVALRGTPARPLSGEPGRTNRQNRSRPRLALKAIRNRLRRRYPDRNITPQSRITSFLNLAHATLADSSDKFIRSKALGCGSRHRCAGSRLIVREQRALCTSQFNRTGISRGTSQRGCPPGPA